MIICIIVMIILLIGIFALVWRYIKGELYYKWDKKANTYAPTITEYHFFHPKKLPNPNYNEKLYKKAIRRKNFYNWGDDLYTVLGAIGCIFGGLAALLCCSICLSSNIGLGSRLDYENMKDKHDEYVIELKTNENNDHLYQDIIEFNKELRWVKECYKSPWFNWFINQKVAENIEYIEKGG